MRDQPSGRRVVITGGLGALGAAVKAAFVRAGDAPVLIDAAKQDAEEREPGRLLADINLSDMARAQFAMAQSAALLGGIDVLVNVAGAYARDEANSEALVTLQRMWLANVATCFKACVAAIPHMQQGGRIVNVGAAAAVKGTAGHSGYAAAKSGVARLTESLAEETLGRGVAVNAVLPGIMDTAANRAAMPDADPAAWTAPSAIADVIEFLASHRARAINGALVPVTAAVHD